MRRVNPIFPFGGLALTACLSACVVVPEVESIDCTPDSGGAHTITYGVQNKKTIFEVKEKVSVHRGYGLVFRLKPKNSGGTPVNFEDATVTIVGKPDTKNSWFTEISGSVTDDGDLLGICVPSYLDTNIEYEYMIHVAGLGTLDPRVEVQP